MTQVRAQFLATVAALAALGGLASAQNSDRVIPAGQEKPLPGQVLVADETLADVVVQVGGARSTFKREGTRIQYGPGEAPFGKAIAAMQNGDFAGAIGVLEPLKPEREIFVPRRLYLLGRCFEGLDRAKEAEDKYSELVQKHENNYYAGLGIRSLVEVQIRNQNFAGAVATADRGIAIAQKLKVESAALLFRNFKAMAFEAQNELGKAEAEYRAIASAAGSSKESAGAAKLANIGLGRIAARQGDAPKAKTLLEPILKDTDPSILGPAYSAMGEALLAQGIKESNVERLREAAIDNFLRVIVQCPPMASESQDPLEAAMFGYARAAKRITELDKEKLQQEFWTQEGLKYCKEFQERFKTSRYAKQVAELRKEFKG